MTNINNYGFTLYPSPYLVWGEDSVYAKHIFVGSERIVSRLGNVHNSDLDPWGQEKAGYETSSIAVNYAQKRTDQMTALAGSYAALGVPYHGTDYSGLQGEKNFSSGPTTDKLQFYYHNDHLASTAIVTNADGEVTQRVEYLPYGEVFYEEQNQIEVRGQLWNTTYKFNGKELDEETGLYYYGARYFDPHRIFWYGTDPLQEKHLWASSYSYTLGNPVCMIDLYGKEPIYSSKGKYLGSSSEGFTGQIYVFYGKKNVDFSKYKMEDLLHSGFGNSFVTYESAAKAKTEKDRNIFASNVFTHIAKNFQNIDISGNGMIFNLSTLYKGEINYENIPKANFATKRMPNGHVKISFSRAVPDGYEATVENLASTILVHEWWGHGLLKWGDNHKKWFFWNAPNHHQVYDLVRTKNRFFPKVTPKYRSFIDKMYNYYYDNEK